MLSPKHALALVSQLSLASLLMLPGVTLVPQLASAAKVHALEDAVDAYYNNDHGYCDAQMLSAYWGKSTYQAKAKAGDMILDGQDDDLQYSLTQARRRHADQVNCWYSNDGFNYEDAVAVANYWNMSIGDAKAALGTKLEHGNLSTVRQVVTAAHQYAADETYSADEENLAVFIENNSYCDAQMLSAYWGKTPYQAKIKAGQMMRENAQFREVEIALQNARHTYAEQVDCRYSDSGFDYDDAVAVANYWQTSVEEAKVGIEQKLKAGNYQATQQLVWDARQAHLHS